MALTDLFSNPLFLQYLSSAGGAISQGQPVGPALNQVTQQGITNQSYAKLLSKLLANGGKMNLDKDNVSIKAPTSALGNGNQTNQGSGVSSGLGTVDQQNNFGLGDYNLNPSSGSAESTAQVGQGSTGTVANPFAGMTAADLAGLSPQDISSALSFKFNTDQFTQQKINDAINAKYKEALIRQVDTSGQASLINAATKYQEAIRSSPLEVPGLGKLDFDQWKSLDTKTKAYSYYAYDAQKRGDRVLSYNDWAQQAPLPTIKQISDLAEQDTDFKDFYFKSKKAGATRISIGEKVDTAEALADVEAKKYFSNPKGLNADVEKYINSEDVQNKLFSLGVDQQGSESVGLKRDFIKSKITSSGGKIIDVSAEGRNVTWTVKWPDGKTSEVSYAF